MKSLVLYLGTAALSAWVVSMWLQARDESAKLNPANAKK